MQVSLPVEAIFRATKFVPTNFNILSNNETYPCHLVLVSAHSGTIASIIVEDNSITEYQLKTEDPNKLFQEVINLINGETILVDSDNAAFLHSVGIELKIPALMNASRQYLPDKGANAPIDFSPLSPFKGIFAYLSPNHDESEYKIEASSCSTYGHPNEVVNQEPSLAYWESEDKPEQYIQFDFINKKVLLNAYSLRSSSNETDMLHPKSWIFAGSNDEEEWFTLDQQDHSVDLNSGNAEMSWECSNRTSDNPFRFIRLQMVEPNHFGSWIFRLSRIELFGILSE